MFNRWVGYNEGGNETHIKELAVFLHKSGHKIDILTTGNTALKPIKKYIHRIFSVPSPQKYFSYSHLRFIYSIKYIFDSFVALRKILKNNKYDIITVHFSLEALIVRFIRALYGIPYALILVGDTDLELIEGKRANNVSQLTKFMAEECVPYGYYPEILTKGIDRKRFNPQVDGSLVRQKYIKKQTQFLVLSVCRLDPRKSLDTLIKAASILEKKYPDKYKFAIVGSGVEENKLKKLIKRLSLQKVVHMVGGIPSTSDLLPQYYSACDIFALPTLYEGFGYVFSEAMAFGKPVIGTRTSAVPEVVEGVGLIVAVKSPYKLASAIKKLYINKKLRTKLSEKSLKRASQWYWDKLIHNYEDFLYKALSDYRKTKFVFAREIGNFIIDIPKILFIGIKPMLSITNTWGSKINR